MFFKVRLLNDESTKWLLQQRIKVHLSNTIEGSTIEEEWINIKNMLKKAAYESIGMMKKHNRRRYLKCWNEDINTLVNTNSYYIRNG
jgi:hypothetical protein